MKRYFFFVIILLSGFLITSCSKSGISPEPDVIKIDNVYVFDKDGSIFDQLKYDATNGILLEAMPKIRTRTYVEHGKLYDKKPNNSGGWNYYCWTDPEAICYSCSSCNPV